MVESFNFPDVVIIEINACFVDDLGENVAQRNKVRLCRYPPDRNFPINMSSRPVSSSNQLVIVLDYASPHAAPHEYTSRLGEKVYHYTWAGQGKLLEEEIKLLPIHAATFSSPVEPVEQQPSNLVGKTTDAF